MLTVKRSPGPSGSDYVLPVGDATALVEARWLHEFDSRNRLEGDVFWLKAVW